MHSFAPSFISLRVQWHLSKETQIISVNKERTLAIAIPRTAGILHRQQEVMPVVIQLFHFPLTHSVYSVRVFRMSLLLLSFFFLHASQICDVTTFLEQCQQFDDFLATTSCIVSMVQLIKDFF
jgi:hypothetical protein